MERELREQDEINSHLEDQLAAVRQSSASSKKRRRQKKQNSKNMIHYGDNINKQESYDSAVEPTFQVILVMPHHCVKQKILTIFLTIGETQPCGHRTNLVTYNGNDVSLNFMTETVHKIVIQIKALM